MKEVTLTTVDNPFDPFEQFTAWRGYDLEKGYQCCEKLAKIARITDDMTQIEIDKEIDRAIEEIIQYDILNIYKKAVRK
jgi:hypothetical protein